MAMLYSLKQSMAYFVQSDGNDRFIRGAGNCCGH
jgi:hypothetical protein